MMKSLLAAAAVVALSAGVAVASDVKIDPAPAATPAEAAASAAVEAATDAAPAVVETTLKDGTKIAIEGDMVSVVGADGAKTAAPDGEHELHDGTKVTTKEGKIVKPEGEAHGDDHGEAAH